MADSAFPNLLAPLTIRGCRLKNRIFSTGHMTTLVAGGAPSEDLAAYHEARAAGGAALVIVEVAVVHPTGIFTTHTIDATSDACIPRYRRIAAAGHTHCCMGIGQSLIHGRQNITTT